MARSSATSLPRAGDLVRYLWVAPATLVGLLVVLVASLFHRVHCAGVSGVLEAHGPSIGWALRRLTLVEGGVAAMTLGHVVIGIDAGALERTRIHERVHVRQYERWGVGFLPAYLLASLWAIACGRHPYFDNPFEREAFRLE